MWLRVLTEGCGAAVALLGAMRAWMEFADARVRYESDAREKESSRPEDPHS
jgi:uncharacterized protein YecT (DUF1311 family)